MSLAPGSTWLINRPITIEFDQPVNFGTVSLNSINIRQVGGTPAIGEFSLLNPTTISFQPLCPRLSDFSDAGLLPGGVQYELRILGQSAYSVRSTSGAILATSEQREFSTPNSIEPAELFFDTVAGAPNPVVRSEGSLATDASYVEIGSDPNSRAYFERAPTGLVSLENGLLLPHNLLSDSATHVAFLIAFNQPVDPSNSNLDSSRVRLEYRKPTPPPGGWVPLVSHSTLEQNCAGTGSLVRIEPVGALPSGADLRVFLAPEFRDIVGQKSAFAQTAFAPASTTAALATQADSLEEEFTAGAGQPGSQEDQNLPLGLPLAQWGGGSLATGFGFTGSGGVNGDFDWEVKAGQIVVLDTTISSILGGPGFGQTAQQVVVGGVLDVRNMRVVAGGTLKITGPNPVTILASGYVQIDGTIDVSGTDSRGVGSLNTTNIPEPGAPGIAGGGKGGTGSPLTTASSPKATDGEGAFGQPNVGGVGGQASFYSGGPHPVDGRRGTGGGGGRFGQDQIAAQGGLADQSFIGLDAEPGFNNLFIPGVGQPAPIGAVSGVAPPQGGAIGSDPFIDGDPNNNFFGSSFDSATNNIILGELPRLWAGSGGGGGGDAIWSNGGPFPVLPFVNTSDEKGAGGGGGGGSVQILALGKITFGPIGQLNCRGGSGGSGENTNGFDRVGGGSGAGSGGHVMLQTASQIDFSQAVLPAQVSILVTGGQGGAGMDSLGGAQLGQGGTMETTPALDACPLGFPIQQCRGTVSGAGGDGSPGIVQLHTPNGLGGGDILLPPGRTLADLCKPTPVSATATLRMIPSFGRHSVARSLWIPMGLGGFDPQSAAFRPATFDFGNVNPATGEVLTTGGLVNLAPALLGPVQLTFAPGLPFITVSGRTMVMDASALIGGPEQYFLDNTGLLKRATLRLSKVDHPAEEQRFDVVAAVYDPVATPPTLHVTVSNAGPDLASFLNPNGVAVELIPTFFRVMTNGVDDALPSTAGVFLKFQAAPATSAGVPDVGLAEPASPGPDISVLNASPNNSTFRFLRFQVEFDIDKLATGITPSNPRPALDFLRLPFRY